MDEVVDVCVGSLHLIARDPNSRLILRQLNSIPLFIQVCHLVSVKEALLSLSSLDVVISI